MSGYTSALRPFGSATATGTTARVQVGARLGAGALGESGVDAPGGGDAPRTRQARSSPARRHRPEPRRGLPGSGALALGHREATAIPGAAPARRGSARESAPPNAPVERRPFLRAGPWLRSASAASLRAARRRAAGLRTSPRRRGRPAPRRPSPGRSGRRWRCAIRRRASAPAPPRAATPGGRSAAWRGAPWARGRERAETTDPGRFRAASPGASARPRPRAAGCPAAAPFPRRPSAPAATGGSRGRWRTPRRRSARRGVRRRSAPARARRRRSRPPARLPRPRWEGGARVGGGGLGREAEPRECDLQQSLLARAQRVASAAAVEAVWDAFRRRRQPSSRLR